MLKPLTPLHFSANKGWQERVDEIPATDWDHGGVQSLRMVAHDVQISKKQFKKKQFPGQPTKIGWVVLSSLGLRLIHFPGYVVAAQNKCHNATRGSINMFLKIDDHRCLKSMTIGF